MQVRKTSIFVLSLLLSYEAFGANASIRAGALRLNQPQNSVSNTANKTTSEKLSINDTLSGYNRASSLRPNRVQVSGGGNKNPAVNEEVLNKVYEDMERVTSAVEQELYLTSREIKTLKDEIAEKDEKIKDLELALEDYEEMKETVKNIPNIYYSKKEVDSKGYVMPSTLSSAIETAKSTVKKEALAEVNSKGFITSSAVADEIAQAKNAAVSAAVAQVENMNFATANSVAAAETRMANAIDSAKATITNERNAALQLYAKTSDVASEITLAKNTAIADAKTQTIAAIEGKNYATQQFVNTELSNLDLGIDEAAVGTIIESKLLAKDYATKSFAENKASAALNEAKSYTNTSVNNETTSRQAAINTIDSRLLTYATRSEVEEAIKPESIATGLLNNNQFKTELVSAVNQDVSALSTRVGALEAEDTTINNRLATFSTKQELSGAVADINNTIDNLELGIDENVVIGIIDDQIGKKKVLTESSNVFTAVKNTVDAIPDNYYSMSTVDKKIADAVTGGEIDLSGYLAKNELIGELKNISDTDICLTKDCIAGLDLGVDEDAVISIIGNQFSENKVLTENSTAFKSVKDTVDAIPNNYYSMSTVDKKIADAVTGGEIDLSGYLAKEDLGTELKNISDTEICLTKNCVAGQVADGISGLELVVDEDTVIGIIENKLPTITAFKAVKDTVDAIPNNYYSKETVDKKIADAASGGEIDLSGYLKTSDFTEENLTKMKNGKLMTSSDTVDLLKDKGLLRNDGGVPDPLEQLNKELVISKITDNTCTTKECLFKDYTTTADLAKDYATKPELDSYVLKTSLKDENGEALFITRNDLKDDIIGIKDENGEALFITRNNVAEASLADALLKNETFTAGLNKTYATINAVDSLGNRVGALETAEYLKTSDFTKELVISKITDDDTCTTKDCLFKDYTKTEDLERDYATKTALNDYVLTSKLKEDIEGLNTFVTVSTVEDLVTEKVDPNNIANELLNNNQFKTDLIAGVSTDVSGLKTRVDALEAKDIEINNKFALYTDTEGMNSAIDSAVSAEKEARESAIDGLSGTYATKTDLNGYATESYVATEVGKEATARDAALADYVSNDGLNDAIASSKAFTDMAADIQKNATAAAAASEAATAAQSTANTASATASAANTAAGKAQTAAEAADAKAVAAADAASAAQTAAEAVDGKIGNLAGVVTGKDATVAEAIAGVKSTADNAAAAASTAQTAAEAVDGKIGDLSKFNGVTVADAIAGVDDAVDTLESKALTTENYCTNKPSECPGGGIGTEGKQ